MSLHSAAVKNKYHFGRIQVSFVGLICKRDLYFGSMSLHFAERERESEREREKERERERERVSVCVCARASERASEKERQIYPESAKIIENNICFF